MGFLRSPAPHDSGSVAIRNYRDVIRNYDVERYGRFVRGMAAHGIRLIGRGIWYISTAHSDADVEQTAEVARQTMAEMAE
jgi:glutamate-1-semialdehyde 2,1-aminomutase